MNRVRELREKLGLSQQALGERVNASQSQIDRLEKGQRKLSLDWITRLAPHLGVDPIELMPDMRNNSADVQSSLRKGKTLAPVTPPPLPDRRDMPNDVPIFGTAAGSAGDGAFHLNHAEGAVDYARRPPGISHAREVFAIFVEGDSMMPAFRPGALVYLAPQRIRPVHIGDDIVIVRAFAEPGRAPQTYLKRLVRRTATDLIVEQFNPKKELRFKLGEIRDIFKVLEMRELMGV